MNDGTAARADRHETLGREAAERLPNWAAAYTELLRQAQLLQLRSRRKPVRKDLLAQIRVRALRKRQVLESGKVVRIAVNGRLRGRCIVPAEAVGSLARDC